MRHVPVLLGEVIESLQLKPGFNVVDCTLGDAGHSEEILKRISPNGKLLGIDADPEAILRAKKYLYDFGDRVVFVRDNFENLSSIIKENNFGPVNAILMDLGWSSPQFEERGRGFSFQNEKEDLNMDYSVNNRENAKEILNSYSEDELQRIFSEYGEEELSSEIAKEIVDFRKNKKIEIVSDLVNIILQVYRRKLKTDKEIPWVGGLHPATKVFQALRIAVNDELGVIERVLPQAIDALISGGRLAVITFHSLEDRLVKHFFKSQEDKSLKLITKKPIICSETEYEANPRARSAKLRIIEKI